MTALSCFLSMRISRANASNCPRGIGLRTGKRSTPSGDSRIESAIDRGYRKREKASIEAKRASLRSPALSPSPTAGYSLFGGIVHASWDTTRGGNPLGRRRLVFRPYIFHGTYWYESGYSRGNGWNGVPCRPLTSP